MVVGLNLDETSTLTGRPRSFCMTCDKPTTSRTGICSRGFCNRGRRPNTTTLHPEFKAICVVCGKPVGLRRHRPEKLVVTGYYCREHKGLAPRYGGAEQHSIVECELCGGLTRSRHSVCKRTPECKRAFIRRSNAEHPEYAKRARIRTLLADPLKIPKHRDAPLHAAFCCVCGTPLIRRVLKDRSYCDEHTGLKARTGAIHPCELCGLLTRSPYGVCSRRGTVCCKEYRRRRARAIRGPAKSLEQPFTCEVCGRATSSIYGVCWRNDRSSACTREYRRRVKRKDVRHGKAV